MRTLSILKAEPEVTVARCEERVAFWTDVERRARERAAALRRPPTDAERSGGVWHDAGGGRMVPISKPDGPMLALARLAEHSRKAWGEALEVAMARERSA